MLIHRSIFTFGWTRTIYIKDLCGKVMDKFSLLIWLNHRYITVNWISKFVGDIFNAWCVLNGFLDVNHDSSSYHFTKHPILMAETRKCTGIGLIRAHWTIVTRSSWLQSKFSEGFVCGIGDSGRLCAVFPGNSPIPPLFL